MKCGSMSLGFQFGCWCFCQLVSGGQVSGGSSSENIFGPSCQKDGGCRVAAQNSRQTTRSSLLLWTVLQVSFFWRWERSHSSFKAVKPFSSLPFSNFRTYLFNESFSKRSLAVYFLVSVSSSCILSQSFCCSFSLFSIFLFHSPFSEFIWSSREVTMAIFNFHYIIVLLFQRTLMYFSTTPLLLLSQHRSHQESYNFILHLQVRFQRSTIFSFGRLRSNFNVYSTML